MKVNRKELIKVLNDLFSITGRGEENPSNMYSVIPDENLNWYIAATNNCVAAIVPVPFKFDTPFKAKADLLLPLLKKIKADEVDIITAASNLIIRTDIPSEVVISMGERSKTMLDFIMSIDDEQFKELPYAFTQMLKVSSAYALDGTGSTKSVLSYVYVQGNTMCAANRSELIMYELDKPMDKMFISATDIPLISDFNLTHYAYAEDLLYFKADNGAFIAVRPASRQERFPVIITEEDFTDVEKINMCNMKPSNLFNTEGLREMHFTDKETSQIINTIHTCMLLSGDNADFICKFDMQDLSIKCTSLKGCYEEHITLQEGVSPVIIHMNPMDFVNVVEKKAVIYFGDNKVLTMKDNVKQYIQASIGYGTKE